MPRPPRRGATARTGCSPPSGSTRRRWTPAGGRPPDDGGDEGVAGRPLGDFRLVREIGRGGMGVVYEAVQLSLGRRVAVKVLSVASSLDSKHLQRFRNE